MKKSLGARIAAFGVLGVIALGVAIFLLVNLTVSLFFSTARLDLTENSIYTISDGARNTIAKIEEPMTLRMYASEALQNLPGLQAYSGRVEGLLSQLAADSGGMLKVRLIHPEPFSPEEDQAVAFGLRATPLNNAQVLFGIVITNHLDESRVIPFLTPEREPFLEYDLTKAIDELLQRQRPRVGLLNYIDFAQGEQQGELVALQQLREQFDLVDIERDATQLPDDLSTLVLLHPGEGMSDELARSVDQFLLRDGKLIMAVDPLLQHGQRDPQSPSQPASDPSRLFKGWGIDFANDKVVADPVNSLQVNMQTPQGLQPINHPSWLQYGGESLNRDDIVTGELNQVRIISGGALALREGVEGIVMQPLISSSANAGTIRSLVMNQPSPELWQSSYKVEGQKVLAARFSGKFQSAFDDVSGDGEALRETASISNLLVIADIDMLVDRYWVEVQNFLGQQLVFRSADNGVLLQNAVDNMASSSNLISLRSRGIRERRFEVVSELRQQASVQFRRRQEELEQRLRATEERINQLRQQTGDNNQLLLNQAQQDEIQRFQQERAQTRQQLRQLQLQLNRDIENLGLLLKFLNIVLLPLILLLLAVFLPHRLGRRA